MAQTIDDVDMNSGLLFHYSVKLNNYHIRTEKHQGRDHLVLPVVMMTEGVHVGSHGPLFHAGEHLSKFPGAWNGIPVTMEHPVDDMGFPCSANSPARIEQDAIGRVFNTLWDGTERKLKGEVWVDKDIAGKRAPKVLDFLSAGKPIEVSVGVFTEDDPLPGTWNEEDYVAIAKNHRPDHLALLPGGVGACSWADGCGIRLNNNEKKEEPKMAEEKKGCPEKVGLLIQAANSPYTERDMEWLLELGAPMLDRLSDLVGMIPETTAPTVMTAAEMVQKLKADVTDIKVFMALFPDEMQAKINEGLAMYEADRATTIKTIVDNSDFTDEDLAGKSSCELKKLAVMAAKATPDYSGQNAGTDINANKSAAGEVLVPAGV